MKTFTIYRFSDVDKYDLHIIGKNALQLAELEQAGFPIAPGFIISTKAYFQFINHNNIKMKIKQLLSTIHFDQPESVHQVSNLIKKLILQEQLSEEFMKDVYDAYSKTTGFLSTQSVSLTSSPVVDNDMYQIEEHKEYFEDIKGETNLMIKIKEIWVSVFHPKSLMYRQKNNVDHFRYGMAIIVQKTIKPETQGILYTIDPETSDKSKIVIETEGGGDKTHFVFAKNSLILENKKDPITNISQNQLLDLALLGKKLDKYFYLPHKIFWAITSNQIYLHNSRGGSCFQPQDIASFEKPTKRLHLLLKGIPAANGLVTGQARVILGVKDIINVKSNDIIIIPALDPKFKPALKKAAAIISDSGDKTSQVAFIARDFGIPAIVGCKDAVKKIKDGQILTINGNNGEVYKSAPLNGSKHTITATKIFCDNPDNIKDKSDVDGIIIRDNLFIKDLATHPKKILRDGKKELFIEKLAKEVWSICKLYFPKPVLYSFSDTYSEAYAKLKGGKDYEIQELNPLLGFRGAYRYINEPHLFAMELEAIKLVKEYSDINNLWLTIPFIRNTHEFSEIKRMLDMHKVHRSPIFQLWLTVSIPANIFSLEEFIKMGIDGVVIDIDMLTTLLLGVDNENHTLNQAFNQNDSSVLRALEQIIKTAHKHHVHTILYGKELFLNTSLLETAIKWGITSVVMQTEQIKQSRELLHEIERKTIENK